MVPDILVAHRKVDKIIGASVLYFNYSFRLAKRAALWFLTIVAGHNQAEHLLIRSRVSGVKLRHRSARKTWGPRFGSVPESACGRSCRHNSCGRETPKYAKSW